MNQKLNESNNDFEWIVFCVGGGAPTVAHDTEENAKQEAARLLKLEPSKRFYVARIKWSITAIMQTKEQKLHE